MDGWGLLLIGAIIGLVALMCLERHGETTIVRTSTPGEYVSLICLRNRPRETEAQAIARLRGIADQPRTLAVAAHGLLLIAAVLVAARFLWTLLLQGISGTRMPFEVGLLAVFVLVAVFTILSTRYVRAVRELLTR